jgi:putative pyruvate formate lyase activating enzyme
MPVKTRHATERFVPGYIRLYESGELAERANRAVLALGSCQVCPRNCRVNRLEDRFAVCKTGRHAVVASYFPHFWRRRLPARLEGLGHDLLFRMQPAVRLLPEL